MDPLLERLEVERTVTHQDHLAVEDATLGQRATQRLGELREVPVERLLVAALGDDRVAVAKDDRAEAVPLGLVEVVALREVLGELGEHRL